MTLCVKTISEDLAERFWNQATNPSSFVNPSFLNFMSSDIIHLGAYKGDELLFVWSINGNQPAMPFAYYTGPYRKEDPKELPSYKTYTNDLIAFDALTNFVEKNIGNLSFTLSPQLTDIRGFLWWNYGQQDKPTCKININYTAILDISDIKKWGKVDLLFRPDDKRKKLRQFIKKNSENYDVCYSVCEDIILEMYKETMQRTGGHLNENIIATLGRIVRYIHKHNRGIILGLIDKKANLVAGFQILLFNKESANAVAQCVRDEYRNLNINTYLTYLAINYTQAIGLKKFDFNGANSPKRADDKHAFGAKPLPYFGVTIE